MAMQSNGGLFGSPSSYAYTQVPTDIPGLSPQSPEEWKSQVDLRAPVIQFASSTFFCIATEMFVVLDVIRIGDLKYQSEVSFYTEDLSSIAGEDYIRTQGRISFQPGEHRKQIQIGLLDDGLWNTSTEFKAILAEDGLVGGILGKYLFEARVKIIDPGAFPSDNLKNVTRHQVSPRSVLIEFFYETFERPSIRRGTLWCLAVDFVHNLWFCLSLFMSVYLLNYIIRTDKELWFVHHRTGSLMLYAGITVGSLALLHILDYSKLDTRVGGAKAWLQSALVKKYLNLSAPVRQEVTDGMVIMAIQRDAPAIATAYIGILELINEIEKFVAMMVFMFVSPEVFGTKFHVESIAPLLLFPVLLGVFLAVRSGRILSSMAASFERENSVTDQVDLVTDNFELVLDYDRKALASESFDRSVQAHGQANKAVAQVTLNTDYFTKWVTCLVICGYVYIGGLDVINETLSVGMFITNLKIFDSCGDAFAAIFNALVDMQRVYPSMMNVFELLNLRTDDVEHVRMTRAAGEQLSAMEARRLSNLAEGANYIAEDMTPISINLYDNFNFAGAPEGGNVSLNFKGKIEIDQGQLVAFVGGIGTGKSTLLRLIARRLLPDEGRCNVENCGIYVPSHLRIASVCTNPIFYHGTLYENLTFGTAGNNAGDRQRIMDICLELGVSSKVLSFMDLSERWQDVFSEAERKLLNIARALFFNAEVTCFHNPLVKLDMEKMPVIMKVLRKHVQNKGVGLDETHLALRRPRTIFLTSSNATAVMEADRMYKVNTPAGISLMSQEAATQMLRSSFLERSKTTSFKA